MDALLGVFEKEFLGLGEFGLFQCDLFRIYLFDLLVVKEQVDLQGKLLLIEGNISLNSEMDDVIQLNLFFIVLQEVGLRQKRRTLVMNACLLYYLGVSEFGITLVFEVFLREGKRMGIDFLWSGMVYLFDILILAFLVDL